ncbi:hypothetical protein D9756_007006 [Leucocoprinus leucothites]|uniref:F-box domain-containing protein n=1 Tax=Leucocoprinus leucothites TaxID=201217 RepID=A0A8H5D5U3_9AGAR|nr:hypothetical protein D9756_007006 [Leucoagaricus leucothites]
MSCSNSLPVELLAHIFSLATHGEEDNSFSRYSLSRPTFDTTTVKVPVAVSCVSRYWRHVALNTPALWTSLCITLEMIMEDEHGRSYLDNSFLNLYLARSQMYPLDILIDARDPAWSFGSAEPDAPFHCGAGVYWPPFSPHHMLDAVNTLLPHIHRWRSLEILADVWAPMFIGLSQINPFLMSQGAPRLEYLALSRCNQFASFSHSFYPSTMKDRPLFSHEERSIPTRNCGNLLPSLRHLKLQGVHVDWSMLGLMLSRRPNGASLASLELDYHSRDVRPSLEEFHQILSSSYQLETLSISGSGPIVTDLDDDATLVHHDYRPVSLPKLRNLTLGYHDVAECQTVLELLNAPNTRAFQLEDANYKVEPEEVDAGAILTYLATGDFSEFGSKTSSSSRAAFPSLNSFSLSSVRAGKRSLNTFLSSVPRLRDLSVNSMDLEEVLPSLLPSALNATHNSILCPCPRLEKLTLGDVDPDHAVQCHDVVAYVDERRRECGSLSLRYLDVQELRIEDVDEDMDFYSDEGAEFSPGGAFDDPEFDRSFTTAALQYR